MGSRTWAAIAAILLVGSTSTSIAAPVRADALPTCDVERHVVVTDVDETLTTSDLENFRQILDPSHDQQERVDASATFTAFRAKGYWVVYVTARPETLVLRDGRPYRQATLDWFDAHGFPRSDDASSTYLAPELLSALLPRGYKGQVIKALQGAGYQVDYAYGNAATDFQAFSDAGIPLDHTFSIGKLAGWGGTTPIAEEGYTDHLASFVPTVPAVCDPAATPPGDPSECPPVQYDGLFPWLFRDLLALFQVPIASHVLPCH